MGSQSEYSGSAGGGTVQLGDNGESAALVQQARDSAGGFDYGSDRAIASPPNWASQESTQLYQGATVNNDPATAEATGQAWKSHGDELHQAATDLYNAIAELGNVWVGQGAASAQGALVGIAGSSKQAGDAAHTMSNRMAQQAQAAAEVKKMPAPKEFDPAKQTAAMLAGGPAAMVADMKQQSDEAKAVHAQQVQYFNAYTQAMSDVDSATPSFGPESLGLPPDGSISGATRASSVGAGSGGIVGAYGGGSLGPAGGFDFGGDSTRGAFAGGLGQAGGPAAGAPGAVPPGAPGAPAPGAAVGTGAAPAAHITPTASSSGGGSGAALAAGLGLAGAGLAAAGGKTVLSRGNKSGAKENTDDTAAAATAESGQAQQQGHSAAANMPQQQLMNSGGTIGSNTPPPGMGGMGGAGAQGAEDEEHQRASFLIEADPDEAFGANVATAPPVIGAWGDEDED